MINRTYHLTYQAVPVERQSLTVYGGVFCDFTSLLPPSKRRILKQARRIVEDNRGVVDVEFLSLNRI